MSLPDQLFRQMEHYAFRATIQFRRYAFIQWRDLCDAQAGPRNYFSNADSLVPIGAWAYPLKRVALDRKCRRNQAGYFPLEAPDSGGHFFPPICLVFIRCEFRSVRASSAISGNSRASFVMARLLLSELALLMLKELHLL